MGLLGSYKSAVGGLYSNMLNPSDYLQNNDVGYYVPFLNQGKIAQENLSYQKQQQAYNMSIQERIFGREDNSIARRVADLTNSGLSPVLAAGQGAGTGQTVNISPPQLQDYPDTAMMAMNLMKMEADVSATRAQEEYTRLQKENAEKMLPAQLSSIEAQIKNADASTYKTYQDAKKAKVEGDNMINTGTSGTNPFSQWYRDLFGAQNNIKNEIKNLKDKSTGKPVKDPIITPHRIEGDNKKKYKYF